MSDPLLNDGCTGFPDGVWEHCCNAHDPAFLYGQTLQDFINANEAFRICVELSANGAWWGDPLSWLMWLFVSGPIGWLFFKRGKWVKKNG